MMGYPDGSRSPGRQLVGIALVIILHVLIIYALTKGLPRKTVEIYWPPLEIKLIEESKPVPPKPDVPLPPPKARLPQVVVPEVIVTVAPQLAITVDHGDTFREGSVGNGEGTKGAGRIRTAHIDAKRPCPRPEYPAGSLPEVQQGTVVLRLLISRDGEVTDSAIESSSGFPNLDEAARRALSRCLYKPETNDYNPAQSWRSFKFRWRLE